MVPPEERSRSIDEIDLLQAQKIDTAGSTEDENSEDRFHLACKIPH